jgi:hypothetical protein
MVPAGGEGEWTVQAKEVFNRQATRQWPLALVAAAALLAACSTVQIDSEYDRGTDFTRLKTFRWVDTPPVNIGDPRIDDQVLQARVQMAVNRELEAKGLRRIDGPDADVLVNYAANVVEKMTGESVNDKYGYGPGDGWTQGARQGWSWGLGAYDAPGVPATYYEEGSIIIDLIDPATKRLMWRGSASTVVTLEDDDEVRRQRLNDAIQRVFTQYPVNCSLEF